MDLAIGIDLGTTNSCIAISDGECNAKVIAIPNSRNGIYPSCVKYLTRDKVEVGESSYRDRAKPSVVYSMKRHMEEGANFKHHVVAEDGSEFDVTPIEVGSHVLRGMLDGAEEYLGEKGVIKKVVITVPAYFTEIARYNTVQAGVMAGLKEEDITLINEPTAAAVSYGTQQTKAMSKVAVYDLGGGTFDVAIIDIKKDPDSVIPNYNVMLSGGNARFGGDDIDIAICKALINKIYSHVVSEGVKLEREDLQLSKMEKNKLILFAENLKKDNVNDVCPFYVSNNWLTERGKKAFEDAGKSIPYKVIVNVTVQMLEDIVKECCKGTINIFSELLNELDNPEIERILLNGGSTKSGALQNVLRKEFPEVPVKAYSDPDQSVALGAAKYADLLLAGKGGKLRDCIQIPIGIGLTSLEGKNYVRQIIKKGEKLPYYSRPMRVETFEDNQEIIRVKVYQGEKYLPEENVLLGEVVIEDIPKMKKGMAKYDITLKVSINGTLTVRVEEIIEKSERVVEQNIVRLSSNSTNVEESDLPLVVRRRIKLIESYSLPKKVEAEFIEKIKAGGTPTEIKKILDEAKELAAQGDTHMF